MNLRTYRPVSAAVKLLWPPKEQCYKWTLKKLVLSIIANLWSCKRDRHLRGTQMIGNSKQKQ